MGQEYRHCAADNKECYTPRPAQRRESTVGDRMTHASPNRGVMIALAYLWPLAVVPLLMEPDDAEVQWHAKHGLVLLAAEILILIAFSTVTSLVSRTLFGVGCVLGLFVLFLWLAITLVHVAAILKGLGGGRLRVPHVSEYADRF
jgi:hypothetical protein